MRRDGLATGVLIFKDDAAAGCWNGGSVTPDGEGRRAVLGSERRVLGGSRREGRRKVAAEIRAPDTASPPIGEHVFDVRRR